MDGFLLIIEMFLRFFFVLKAKKIFRSLKGGVVSDIFRNFAPEKCRKAKPPRGGRNTMPAIYIIIYIEHTWII